MAQLLKKKHNHAPDVSEAKIQMSMSEMKEDIIQSRECTSAVMNRHLEKVQKEYRPYFPTDATMRILQKAGRKQQPALPRNLADLHIEG